MANPKDKPPHYAGHRARLCERFLKFDGDALADYELLELILLMALPRRDVKPLAKSLLETFSSFAEVISAALLLLFPDQINQMVLVKFFVPAEPIGQALKT